MSLTVKTCQQLYQRTSERRFDTYTFSCLSSLLAYPPSLEILWILLDTCGQIHIPVSRFFVLLDTHEQMWDLLDSCENHFSLSDQNLRTKTGFVNVVKCRLKTCLKKLTFINSYQISLFYENFTNSVIL